MTRHFRRAAALCAVIATGAVCAAWPAVAEIKTSTAIRYYTVPGTSQESLARTVSSNPLHRAGGDSIARIDATLSMTLLVEYRGQICNAKDAIVTVRFVMTLPKASEARMPPATRTKWRGLVDFARRHEETHRSIYLQCIRDFIPRARVLRSQTGCGTLTTRSSRLFDVAMKACEVRQQAFDRADGRRLDRLPIFNSR